MWPGRRLTTKAAIENREEAQPRINTDEHGYSHAESVFISVHPRLISTATIHDCLLTYLAEIVDLAGVPGRATFASRSKPLADMRTTQRSGTDVDFF